MDSELITRLKTDFSGRENQIDLLTHILFEDDLENRILTKLLLHGPPHTGKTSILLKLFQLSCKPFTFVNCLECYESNLVFRALCRGIHEDSSDRKYDNFRDLVECLRNVSDSEKKLEYMVIKNASMLSQTFIQAFVQLPDVLSKYGWNFSIIFIDCNTSAYGANIGNGLARVFFPRYNKDELCNIMLSLRPSYPREIYENFLRPFVSCVYHLYRDVWDVLQLADVGFANYKKPIDENKIPENDLQGLYKNIIPLLKLDSNNLMYSYPQSMTPHQENFETTKISTDLELPENAKYLLVAAYVASFVSAKHDKQLFCKKSSKQKKRVQNLIGDCPENKVSFLLGPKQFTLNRLLSIFSALTGRRNYLTSSLLQQVTFLLELKLMALIGNDDGNLEKPRYRCIADFDTVATVARSIDCDFERYLVL